MMVCQKQRNREQRNVPHTHTNTKAEALGKDPVCTHHVRELPFFCAIGRLDRFLVVRGAMFRPRRWFHLLRVLGRTVGVGDLTLTRGRDEVFAHLVEAFAGTLSEGSRHHVRLAPGHGPGGIPLEEVVDADVQDQHEEAAAEKGEIRVNEGFPLIVTLIQVSVCVYVYFV